MLLEPPRTQEDTDFSPQPVFRAAPYRAELQRRRQSSTSLRILILEEGNVCRLDLRTCALLWLLRQTASSLACAPRSVLAEALTQQLAAMHYPQLDLAVQAASIGPASAGGHEPCVTILAEESGLSLPPRSLHRFDNLDDIVSSDIVLVMDGFDQQEVRCPPEWCLSV